MFEEQQATSNDLPEIASIVLIPNEDEQAGSEGDSDDDETVEPKDINRFSAGILNGQAEIDFVDDKDDELPDITEVIFLYIKSETKRYVLLSYFCSTYGTVFWIRIQIRIRKYLF
jgi:hypothetical protein